MLRPPPSSTLIATLVPYTTLCRSPADDVAIFGRYRQLCEAADALTHGERDPIANMANVAALLWEFLPDLNWAGFYRLVETHGSRELVLGPIIGSPACIRIAMGRGVCGAAATSGETQTVEDVQQFPGNIPCGAARGRKSGV